MKKQILALSCAITFLLSATACSGQPTSTQPVAEPVAAQVTNTTSVKAAQGTVPKYVFLFIGDGMSYPQIQLTNYYKSAVSNQSNAKTVSVDGENKTVLQSQNNLSMMDFEIAGSAQTYDSTSFAPDSASTATSIATGHKTWSGSINVSEDFKTEYETIAEKLKEQKDYKIGVISSVNITHATPAAFYAHQASRNSYYEIGLELIESNFDYFAGGEFNKRTTEDGTGDLHQLAQEAGYKVVTTQAEAEALKPEDGKVIVIEENLADGNAMPYNIDLQDGQWSLADYVEKGIEMLDNDNGFFMMVEGGKIDWACHANDAASTIQDTIALDNAVQKAVEFYNEHPDETLIIVTGDHETGGLTIGYAGTNYDTFLTNMDSQKISYAKFDEEYVSGYKDNKTSFDDVMTDITSLFGLQPPVAGGNDGSSQKDNADSHPESGDTGALVLTQYEYDQLKAAYDETMSRTGDEQEFSQAEYVLYGSYEPLTVTITHILNNKSGINFGSYAHTGLPVEVLVKGAGAEQFDGYYDNTEIFNKLASLTQVK